MMIMLCNRKVVNKWDPVEFLSSIAWPGEVATRPAELKFTCSEEHYKTGVRQRKFQRAVDKGRPTYE